MKRLPGIAVVCLCAFLASIYIFPIFSGLVLLPLDLLVINSSPWHLAATLLLKNPFMVDSIIQMFPWRHLTFISLIHGTVPLWNPYQFMGVPFMAGMKPLVFYPANLLFIFGEIRSWNMLLWLQLFLSLWFMYLFMESVGIKKVFALFAAVAFSFSSLMVGVLEFGSEGHVLLWLPFLLYLIKRYFDTEKVRFISWIALVTACSIFAGQIQYVSYVLLLSAAFILWLGLTAKKHVTKTLLPLGGIAVGCMIAGIQLLPAIDVFRQSPRGITGSYDTFSQGLLHLRDLLRLLSPDWFGNPVTGDLKGGYIELSGYFGIIPLFFALYAVFADRNNPFVRFLSAVALAALLFSMDGIAQIFYILHIPVITGGDGGRLFAIVLFSGASLSGFGFSSFINERARRKIIAVISFACIALLIFAGSVIASRFKPGTGVQLSNIKIQMISVVLFGVLSWIYGIVRSNRRLVSVLFIVCIIGLTYTDLFRMGYRFLTFSNPKFLYPEIPVIRFLKADTAQSLGRVYGITEPEINTELQIPAVEIYNPLYPLRTATLLQALELRQGESLLERKYELARNPRMKTVLDFLGVTHVVITKGQNPALTLWNNTVFEKEITKVFSDDRNDVYRNNTVYLRFGLFYDVRTGIPDDLALETISRQSVDFRKTVLIRESPELHISEGSGSARLLGSTVNTLEFTVNSTAQALLYISDTYDPGWQATVNGRDTEIYTANYNFRAVGVPGGTSVVRFRYIPGSFRKGAAVTGTGLLIAFSFIGIDKISGRAKKRKQTHSNTRRK